MVALLVRTASTPVRATPSPAAPALCPATPTAPPDRATRRRLRRADDEAARSAELWALEGLFRDARQIIDTGWLQHGWFRIATPDGRVRVVTERNLALADGHPVVAACLVGALVAAGGGPRTSRSQLVTRAVDLSWRSLNGAARGELAPRAVSPTTASVQVLDMTRWNDAPGRTGAEVGGLLGATAARLPHRG